MTMDDMPIVFFNFALLYFIFWRDELALYIVGGPVCFAFGWWWADTFLVAGLAVAFIGGFCWYMAIMRFLRKR